MLLSEVWRQWWIGDQIGLREVTVIKKEAMYYNHISPFFGNIQINEIDDIMINEYIQYEMTSGNRLTGKPLNNNSINKNLGILNAILEYARLKGYIDFNPMVLVKRLNSVPAREFQIYTPGEVDSLIATARPKWMGDLILLAYHTGMRRGECFGLQWEDINFDKKFLHVRKSISATKPGEIFINDPKTRKGKRIIYLDDETMEMLKKRYKLRTSDMWVFASKYGELLSPWYSTKYFNETERKVKIIPHKRFHDLRHTHITELVEAGISLPIIQQRVGHSDIRMTMKYTHITPETQKYVVSMQNAKTNKRKGEANGSSVLINRSGDNCRNNYC